MKESKLYPAFSNGTEFMWWQGRNCDRCVKASRYDAKRDDYTKYRCQVQHDIELASVTDGMVKKRVYDICSQSDCKYLQTTRKKYPKNTKSNIPSLFDL